MAQKKRNYNQEKRAAKRAAKAIKKTNHPILIVIALILVAAIVFGIWYFFFYKKRQTPSPIQTGDLSVTFFELGNKYVCDCTLIKVGDTEVLIDAGSKQNSAETLVPEIKKLCTDGKLEYVIATHAHEDHIGAFYSTQSRAGIFESFECGTIIDFPLTRKEYSSASVYGRYLDARRTEVEAGAVHYTALQCWNQTDGAKRSYQLADDVTLNVLYHKYYEEYDSNKTAENNYSVCVMITQGTYNYLFTGDLESEGEESLVDKNDLPHCKLFKGGHHGSSTSNTDLLLSAIQPETICICTCAGTPEYAKTNAAAFPTQECIDRMAKYTDKIYVTSLATDVDWTKDKSWSGAVSLNGNITAVSDGVKFEITGSKNSLILKETDWFKQNRIWPSDGK